MEDKLKIIIRKEYYREIIELFVFTYNILIETGQIRHKGFQNGTKIK